LVPHSRIAFTIGPRLLPLSVPRTLAYAKLIEKYQEFNPFKLFVYGAQTDQVVPQVAEPALPK